MARKKSKWRIELGALDVVSAILILIGVYLTNTPDYATMGWVVVVIGILKQFSGK